MPNSFDDATLAWTPHFYDEAEAQARFATLLETIPWKQDTLSMFGRTHPVPRLHQWFADDDMVYRWSGLAMKPAPWTSALLQIRAELEAFTGAVLPTVLANLYRDGGDTVGWHADDEPELGPEPFIASVSFGASRDFVLRHKTCRDRPKKTYALGNGSLLCMSGTTQQHWEHSLPRRKRCTEPRINLTFRGSAREATQGLGRLAGPVVERPEEGARLPEPQKESDL